VKIQTVIYAKEVSGGLPTEENFKIDETDEDLILQDGDIAIDVKAVSVDPYMRHRLKQGGAVGYIGPIKLGGPVDGFIAGVVSESKSDDWKSGDLIGIFGKYSTKLKISKAQFEHLSPVKLTGHITEDQIGYGIGVLGMPGMTAYFGTLDLLNPSEGKVLYVNAATGAVGSLVGQIAKLKGAKVIGSAGGEKKCQILKEKFGFDETVDYKQSKNVEELSANIKKVAPDGIDLYFENVGGDQWDAVLPQLRNGGKVAVCGSISGYNDEKPTSNSIQVWSLVGKQINIQGFLVFRWMAVKELREKFTKEMSEWIKDGKVVVTETVVHGLDQFGKAFHGLMTGAHEGKMVVKV